VYAGGTQLTATTPAQTTAGTVDVVVATPGGTSTTSSSDQFVYDVPPTVSSVAPAGGPVSGGTQVTITGTGFAPDSHVFFGTAAASSFVINSPTSITASTPAVATPQSVDVTVTTFGGTSPSNGADSFSYGSPTVSDVSPNAGPLSGGSVVYISGHGFTPDATVTFGGIAASSVIVNSGTAISATSPAGIAGSVDVVVTTFQGTSATSAVDQFTYDPAPTVTGISPAQGSKYGGTAVTITGTNFTSGTSATFGGLYASVTVLSSTTLVATSPNYYYAYYWYNYYYPRTVNVVVTTPGGSSVASSADQYTFENPPTVYSLSTNAGGNGTSVSITGWGFTSDATVKFGSTQATNVVVNSYSAMTATAPSGSGTVYVTVTDSNGTSPQQNNIVFAYSAPVVSGVQPNAGPTGAGNWVWVSGSNFVPGVSVTFGGVQASWVSYSSPGWVQAGPPPGAAGTVDVAVSNADGSSALNTADQYTYVPPPMVTQMLPSAGPSSGGVPVVIYGANFTANSSVYFGPYWASSVTVVSSTVIEAIAPPDTYAWYYGQTFDVQVYSGVGGWSARSPADEFTYIVQPTVTGVSPNNGPAIGGTQVSISGSGFNPTAVVTFGNVLATSVTVNSQYSIAATSPPGAPASVVDVVVTAAGGQSATSTTDEFTYGGLSPPSGASRQRSF
jgi:hypothetical protein